VLEFVGELVELAGLRSRELMVGDERLHLCRSAEVAAVDQVAERAKQAGKMLVFARERESKLRHGLGTLQHQRGSMPAGASCLARAARETCGGAII
jgi:hypothetical protein